MTKYFYLLGLLILLVACSPRSATNGQKDSRTALNRSESLFYYAPIIVSGSIIERRAVPTYVQYEHKYYQYTVKFLVDKVLKGDLKLQGKEINLKTYLHPDEFYYYKPHTQLTLSLKSVDGSLNAISFDYNIFKSIIYPEQIRKNISFTNLDHTKYRLKPVEELFELNPSEIYHSVQIFRGYVTKTYRLDLVKGTKPSTLRGSDEVLGWYGVSDFFIEKVIRGDKRFENKVVRLVKRIYVDSKTFKYFRPAGGFSCSFLVPMKNFLIGIQEEVVISQNNEEYYLGPNGYDVCGIKMQMLPINLEPAIELYLEEVKRGNVVIPNTPEPLVIM